MMRDSAVFRHTVQDVAIRNGCAAHPGGGQLPKALISPPWEQHRPRLAPSGKNGRGLG